MKDIKYYIGPMTQNVIDSVIEFTNETDVNIGFCMSRRQIDFNGGYVGYNTKDFKNYVKSKTNRIITIERDHSGINQVNEYLPSWLDNRSLIFDTLCGIDIIHLDPWKKFKTLDLGIRETLNNIFEIYSLNNYIQFEIGTEESIFHYTPKNLHYILSQLKQELSPEMFSNIRYAVIQSGTKLVGTKNIGFFELERLKDMISVCKEFGVLSKEHNGDYLSNEEIKIRFKNGLDAINIAPEFGVLETKILLENVKNNDDFYKIYEICLNGGKWKKWVPKEFHIERNKKQLIEICGHYHNKDIKNIVNIDDNVIKNVLKKRLRELCDLV